MNLDQVFKKTKKRKASVSAARRPEVPEGLLAKCNFCGKAIVSEEARRNLYRCPRCGGYFRIPAWERIRHIADAGSFEEWDRELLGGNPLAYPGYEEKLAATRLKTGLSEAIVTGKCRIGGEETALGVMDGRFLMASMGEAVGEKLTRAAERASRGMGKSVGPTIIVIIGSCIFRIVWIYTIFAYFHTIPSLYLLYFFSWVLTAIAEILYFIRTWKSMERRE